MAAIAPLLLPRDVLRLGEPAEHVRVVHSDPATGLLVLFELADGGTFVRSSHHEMAERLRSGTAELLSDHGFDVVAGGRPLSPALTIRSNRLMAAIAPLLAMGVDLFDDRKRGAAIGAIARAGLADRKTLKAALERYFRHGMTPDAIAPGFVGCGGPGKVRTRGTAKLGRPRRLGARAGTNVTPELERIFEIGLIRYYARNRRVSFAKARRLMLKEFCMATRVDPVTRRVVHSAKPIYTDEDFPTVRQVAYWYERNKDVLAIRRERIGRKRYDRDLRGLSGTSSGTTMGPGSRFEIDATIVNVYVVSEVEAGVVIGRPVLYVVVDVFSKMVVGFYVGLEGPSWMGAMMTLVNVVEDKREFCARLGIVIGEDDWPCNFLPEKLLGDRGEIASRIIEGLQRRHHVTVENAQSHRPDWKGSVEKRFDLIDVEFKPFASGYVDPDFGERGVADPRLEAVWTVTDLTAVIAMILMRFNNHHKLVNYPRDGDMIRDGVRAVPAELWEWGVARRQGGLRRASVDAVRFAVMPEAQASVRADGIVFRGLHYTCDKADAEGWGDRARQGRSWRVPISFDPRSARHIYLHDGSVPEGYVVCRLQQRDAHFADASFAEIRQAMDRDKADTADRSVAELEAEADVIAFIEERERAARERAAGYGRRAPKDIKGIRPAHAREKARRRQDEAFDLGEADNEPLADNVRSIHQRVVEDAERAAAAEPTLEQMLKRKDGQ